MVIVEKRIRELEQLAYPPEMRQIYYFDSIEDYICDKDNDQPLIYLSKSKKSYILCKIDHDDRVVEIVDIVCLNSSDIFELCSHILKSIPNDYSIVADCTSRSLKLFDSIARRYNLELEYIKPYYDEDFKRIMFEVKYSKESDYAGES